MPSLFPPPQRVALITLAVASLVAATGAAAGDTAAAPVLPVRSAATPDSRQMQKDLQQLAWPQFRSVIESIPKLKADVEAYGPVGWQVVKDNYRVYPWKRNIDKLDAAQKKALAALIAKAKSAR